MTGTAGGRLDPDRLAVLESERDFLLTSIRDLDEEYAAGEIDRHDYEALKDDYTRRAADTLRAIDNQRAAFAQAPGVGRRQIIGWLVGLAVLGTVAGLLIAQSAGERLDGDQISGGVRTSPQALLEQARRAMADPANYDDVVDAYDEVLEQDPSNVEALTYRSWVRRLRGDDVGGLIADFEEAARLDPSYPDRIPFHAISLTDLDRWDDAAAVLDEIDLETAPSFVQQLLVGRGTLGQVYGESRYAAIDGAAAPTLDDLGIDGARALAAGGYLVGTDKPNRFVAALKLYDAVLDVEPDNATALARRAFLLAQIGEVDQALELLDRAVAAHPDDAEARLTRALLLADRDPQRACTDVRHVETLAEAETLPQAFITQAAELVDALGCGAG